MSILILAIKAMIEGSANMDIEDIGSDQKWNSKTLTSQMQKSLSSSSFWYDWVSIPQPSADCASEGEGAACTQSTIDYMLQAVKSIPAYVDSCDVQGPR